MNIRRRSGASVDHGLWNRNGGSSTRAWRTDGASIAEVARRHDLNTNQLFTWRRQFGVEPAAPQELAPILPVTITPDTTAEYSDPGSNGQMEIVLSDGDRIIVWADPVHTRNCGHNCWNGDLGCDTELEELETHRRPANDWAG